MANSKTYLNVPYAQKDAAKELGARWDAALKKWYVPAVMDVAIFAKWQPQSVVFDSPSITMSAPRSPAPATKISSSSAKNAVLGMITYSKDKNFIAYNGDEPPWD